MPIYTDGVPSNELSVVVFCAHLYPRHIAQQHAAVAAGLDRQGGERFGRLQLGTGVDTGNHVFAFHLTGSREEVVAAYGIGHVGGRQAEAGQLHRVDPDSHGKHLVAENLRLGHAWQRGQLGLDDP